MYSQHTHTDVEEFHLIDFPQGNTSIVFGATYNYDIYIDIFASRISAMFVPAGILANFDCFSFTFYFCSLLMFFTI